VTGVAHEPAAYGSLHPGQGRFGAAAAKRVCDLTADIRGCSQPEGQDEVCKYY